MMPMPGAIALIIVSLLLALTVAAQFRWVRGRSWLLDALALAPQWKFFGQPLMIEGNLALADLHIVVRDCFEDGSCNKWCPTLFMNERRWVESLWNAGAMSKGTLLSLASDLATAPAAAREVQVQLSLPYLVLLRHCFSAFPPGPNAVGRQFAVIGTSGREGRTLTVAFVSARHRW
jgi:hypothetical protein